MPARALPHKEGFFRLRALVEEVLLAGSSQAGGQGARRGGREGGRVLAACRLGAFTATLTRLANACPENDPEVARQMALAERGPVPAIATRCALATGLVRLHPRFLAMRLQRPPSADEDVFRDTSCPVEMTIELTLQLVLKRVGGG